jgi:hypothetical protein
VQQNGRHGLHGRNKEFTPCATMPGQYLHGETGVGAHADGVADVGHLDDRVPGCRGRKSFENGRDGRQCGLVAREQDALGVGRGQEVDAAVHAVVVRVRAEHDELVPEGSVLGPERRRPVDGMHDHVDVDLSNGRAHGTHRVGANRVAVSMRQITPRGVPVVGHRHRRYSVLVERKDQFDALVESVVGERVEPITREGEASKTGRQIVDPSYSNPVQVKRGRRRLLEQGQSSSSYGVTTASSESGSYSTSVPSSSSQTGFPSSQVRVQFQPDVSVSPSASAPSTSSMASLTTWGSRDGVSSPTAQRVPS